MKDAKNDYQPIRVGGKEWFRMNWEDRIEGEIIITSSWELPSGISNLDDDINPTATQVKIHAATVGEYCVINTITTDSDEEYVGKFTLDVQDTCGEC